MVEKKFNPTSLAKKAGLSRTAVRDLLSHDGDPNPRIDTFIKLCKALKVAPHQLSPGLAELRLPSGPERPRRRAEGLSVLLVEDDPADVEKINRAFTQMQMASALVVAADGREALDKLRDGTSVKKPYIILLDLRLPRMTGLEFLKELRADPALKQSIVFILTNSDADREVSQAYDFNVAGYIPKGQNESSFIITTEFLESYAELIKLPV
jgi:CheY-like chemotaxis protein/DNA-binding Xre family transcriptional regulator